MGYCFKSAMIQMLKKNITSTKTLGATGRIWIESYIATSSTGGSTGRIWIGTYKIRLGFKGRIWFGTYKITLGSTKYS